MSEYIDLQDTIVAGEGTEDIDVKYGIQWALEYLDEHPDQVPGRTITESEIGEACSTLNYYEVTGFKSALDVLGAIVVPDTEPTNAEKLKAVLDAIGDSTAGYRERLASKLDEAGVKAPGGDDD